MRVTLFALLVVVILAADAKLTVEWVREQIDGYVDPCANLKPDESCYEPVIQESLKHWKNGGITKSLFEKAEVELMGRQRCTLYQIIDGTLYRSEGCYIGPRCSGVEHFILELLKNKKVSVNTEFLLNVKDWPHIPSTRSPSLPLFSFSVTPAFKDIMYPNWAFWEGGPVNKIFPRGVDRWDLLSASLRKEADKFPWSKKSKKVFFRGSRTSRERDPLIYWALERPDLIDAKYTKSGSQGIQQQQKADGLEEAQEVTLEEHCKYRYLFNFRGVAASFRFRHLFVCRSLVFHVGNEWLEFFYPRMRPWVHYIPIKEDMSDAKELVQFFMKHEDLAEEIANRGAEFIEQHLRMEDVSLYWKRLLEEYSKRLGYQPTLEPGMMKVLPNSRYERVTHQDL